MSASAISAAASASPSQAAPPAGQHRNRAHATPISDVDAQSSSVAASGKSMSRVGSKVDVKV